MRENYTTRLVIIALIFMGTLYVSLPSLGIFPKVQDADGNGILSEVDFKAWHRGRMNDNKEFMAQYDADKSGKLSDAEWEKGLAEKLTILGLDQDPRGLRKLFYAKEITLGLDLQGGIDLIYKVESPVPLKNQQEHSALMTKTITVLKNRIDMLKITEPLVQRYDSDHIRVQLAGKFDEHQVKVIIGQTDLLKFQEVLDYQSSAVAFGAAAQDPENEMVQEVQKRDKTGKPEGIPGWYLLKKRPLLTGDSIDKAFPQFNEFGNPEIGLSFNSEGAKVFAEETRRLVGKQMAIVLGGEVYMAPNIKEQIASGECRIEGSFDLNYVRGIVDVLKAGSLPAKLIPAHENRVGATLGEDSIVRGIKSGQWGLILVFVAMYVWYRGAGIVAVAALGFNLTMLMSILIFLNATLTLPGIAGFILTVGMSVDANVLIFQRIKEELAMGKTIRASIDAGFSRAMNAIVDSNLTTVLTCLVLFNFGSGPLQGFAVVLTMGIMASFFTNVFVVKVLMAAYYNKAEGSAISI